jgi:hypothetical protein
VHSRTVAALRLLGQYEGARHAAVTAIAANDLKFIDFLPRLIRMRAHGSWTDTALAEETAFHNSDAYFTLTIRVQGLDGGSDVRLQRG